MMKVSIIGTHGVPARYGGFETFAEHLAIACVQEGLKTRVINEKANPLFPCPENLEIISSSYNKSKSPFKFYRDSLKLAADSDVILCCGVGGAFSYSGIRSGKTKIITNVDGLEHLRKKYSWLQRKMIFMLQRAASRESDLLVADSQEIWGYWTSRFQKHVSKVRAIRYGADDCLPFEQSVLSKYRLEQREYFLMIARLVPENNIEEIIQSYKKYIGRKKLVIVGPLENSVYVSRLKSMASERIIFTDAIYNKQILDSLRQACFIYIHGHTVGGTNPSLLEAMAAGCACLCHHNVFNLEVTEGSQIYFHSPNELAIMLNLLEHKSNDLDAQRMKAIDRVKNGYSWEKCCSLYIDLFKQLYQK
jgi:glycosyltransferase involved in cell wall biosynthesis